MTTFQVCQLIIEIVSNYKISSFQCYRDKCSIAKDHLSKEKVLQVVLGLVQDRITSAQLFVLADPGEARGCLKNTVAIN